MVQEAMEITLPSVNGRMYSNDIGNISKKAALAAFFRTMRLKNKNKPQKMRLKFAYMPQKLYLCSEFDMVHGK